MVVWCTAYGCSNNQNTKSVDGRKLSFHRFPRDEVYRQAWIKALNKANFVPTKFNYLCSAHFTEDQFDRTKVSKYGRLRATAIPTLFKGHPKHLKKIQSVIAPKTTLKNNVIIENTPLFNSNFINVSPINNVNGSPITVLVHPQTIGSNFAFLPVANNKGIPTANGGFIPDYNAEFVATVDVGTCTSDCDESDLKIVDVRTCTSDYEEFNEITVDVGTCTSDYEEFNELIFNARTCYNDCEKCKEKGVDASTCTRDYKKSKKITVDVGTCTSGNEKSNDMTYAVGTRNSDNADSNEASDNESICDYNVETALSIDEGTFSAVEEDESFEALEESYSVLNETVANVEVKTSAMGIYRFIKTADEESVSNFKNGTVGHPDVGAFTEDSEESIKTADVRAHANINSQFSPKIKFYLKVKNKGLNNAKKRKKSSKKTLKGKKRACLFT